MNNYSSEERALIGKILSHNPYGASKKRVMPTATHYVDRLSRSRTLYADLAIQLRRSKQISYLEPIFQQFLPPELKGQLYISTIGPKFWVIGTHNSVFAMRFRYCQQEIRHSMELHLNQISKKEWYIPNLVAKVIPKKQDDERYERELSAMEKITSIPMESRAEKQAGTRESIAMILKRLEQNIALREEKKRGRWSEDG